MQIKFKVTNIDCGACVKLINMAMRELDGVENVEVDEKTGMVNVTADREIAWPVIEVALKEVGKNAVKI